jgi:hypothetical protein
MAPDIEKPSDIDIFIYGLDSPEQDLEKVHTLLGQIYQGYSIAKCLRLAPLSSSI